MSDEQVAATAPPHEELFADPAFREMVEAGLFFGRTRSRTHPRMKPFILTNRNEIEIINLEKTQEGLDNALAFLKQIVEKGKHVLFVATQPPAQGVAALASEFGFPYVTTRWLGGTLTNFRIISDRIEYYKKLKSDWAKNAFEKHTKKERLEIEREITRLTETLAGLEVMTALPAALVVVDANVHTTAVREARKLGIPVVAFVNTDSDPDFVAYPVVGNTKARTSITWFLEKVKSAVASALGAYRTRVAEAAQQAEAEKAKKE